MFCGPQNGSARATRAAAWNYLVRIIIAKFSRKSAQIFKKQISGRRRPGISHLNYLKKYSFRKISRTIPGRGWGGAPSYLKGFFTETDSRLHGHPGSGPASRVHRFHTLRWKNPPIVRITHFYRNPTQHCFWEKCRAVGQNIRISMGKSRSDANRGF